MKKIFAILLVFIFQLINAQEQDITRAKRYFDKTYYGEAIPLYESIIANNTSVDVVKNLADSYYYTNDLKNAQKYYSFLLKTYYKDLSEEYYFRFSQTLKAVNKYDEANTVLKEYFLKSANSDGLVNLEKGIKELENISAIGKRFDIKNLAINTVNSEFGAVEQNENLIFATVKKKPGLFDKVYKWNGETYLNLVSIPVKNLAINTVNSEFGAVEQNKNLIFATVKKKPGLFDKVYKWNGETYLNLVSIPVKNISFKDSIANDFASELNSSMHESNVVFTKNGKSIYFTRNNSKNGSKRKNKEKISNIQIFKADLVNGKYTNIISLPFNNENYSTEHPALSADERTLYFASDMPGTLGSLDLYSVSINGDTFGTPKNLGNTINTNKKEQFPFVSIDNKLYYSSNGLPGYGSLDVFVSEIKNGEFTRPLNIGLPVNSNLDDFAFNINPDTKKGYFASNRAGGIGGDDIYEILETKDLIIEDCKQFLAGTISDVDTKLPLENALVILQDDKKNEIQRIQTTIDGKFSFNVACETGFTVLASKDNYTSKQRIFNLGKTRNITSDASMALKSLEVIKQEELLVNEQKKKEEEIAIAKEKEDEKVAIANEKIAKEKEKEVAATKKKEKIDKIIAQEKDVVKIKDKLVIKTEPIYFDYDLWYIRKDSKIILKRIIELMNKYPDMVLEIGSHTDMRGNDRYNANLSERRAESTKEFLVDLGIDEKRIIARGYGESEPVVDCPTESSCKEEQHELNRRSEFVIKNL